MPQTRIGEYRVQVNGADVPFWRIVPGRSALRLSFATFTTLLATNDPSTWNTIQLPARFGVFDIVARMTEPVVEQALTDALSVDLLSTDLTGQPVATPMPIWEDGSGSADNRVANFCFAVPIAQGQTHFEGTLIVSAENAVTANAGIKRVHVQLRVGEIETEDGLFIHFVATPTNRRPDHHYCWNRLPVVSWADGAGPPAPLAGADIDGKILRDNYRRGFNLRNRRVALRSDAAGDAVFRHPGGSRNTLAFPTGWPLIFTATKASFLARALLARVERGDIDHNQSPHALNAIQMISTLDARIRLRNHTVLIDPGHAVVYAAASTRFRRSQEWFVAHRIGMRVAQILLNDLGLPAANLFMTRTAGLGLIDPGELGRNDAPERGAGRFRFDVPGRRVRIRNAALGLRNVSDLVLTGDDDAPGNVTVADRDRLIATNAAAIAAIVGRIDAALPAGQRVRPGSVRWLAANNNYVCTIERHPPVAGQNPMVDNARHVLINTGDWFVLDAAMLQKLADRSARWSIARELGSGPGADAATGRLAFQAAARAAMQGENARDYMVSHIINELSLEEPHAAGAAAPANYPNAESKGWHFTVRRDYINRKDCDIALTIHENADGLTSVGMAMLVGHNPPNPQMRAAKLFMKYADPFDQGLRRGGIVEGGAAQLAAGNTVRDKHVYFELEFMTSSILDNPGVRAADNSRYQYQEMTGAAFVNRTADQIVAGTVEFLIDPQADIATISYDLENLPTW